MFDKEKQVSRAIITAKVDNSANWENGFRSHAGLFNDYTATAIHFTATDDNEVAILWEVADLDKFLAMLDAPETAKAMAQDGVKPETVKAYVLDKEFNL
jgi:hypothetical protein